MDVERKFLGVIQTKVQTGEPVRSGGWAVTPVSRSVQVLIPGRQGGVIWNKPVALAVRRGDEEMRILPVIDQTRRAQLLIWGIAAALVILFGFVNYWRSK